MSGLLLGCHLSTSRGYAAMAGDAVSIGATTFAFFTRNPRGGNARALDSDDLSAFLDTCGAHGMGPLVAHAPYTYNLCSSKPETVEFARRAMREDLERMEALPGHLYNFHPGSHVKQRADVGVRLICEGLNEVLEPGQRTTVLLETMAGKGTEVGRSFEELAAIIDGVARTAPALADNLGVCLDTCHVSDAGYDLIGDLDGVLAEFDRVVGLSRLCAVHVNDSKNPCGARKDRHARIGEGYLGSAELGGGEEVFARIVSHPALRDLPFILETPNELPGYAREIELLRSLQAGA